MVYSNMNDFNVTRSRNTESITPATGTSVSFRKLHSRVARN